MGKRLRARVNFDRLHGSVIGVEARNKCIDVICTCPRNLLEVLGSNI